MLYLISVSLDSNPFNRYCIAFSNDVLACSDYFAILQPYLHDKGWKEHDHCNHTFIKDGEVLKLRKDFRKFVTYEELGICERLKPQIISDVLFKLTRLKA